MKHITDIIMALSAAITGGFIGYCLSPNAEVVIKLIN